MTNMTYSLPSFSSFLLSSPEKGSPSKLLVVLCDTIRNHIHPSSATAKAQNNSYIISLPSTTIGLMVSLCWNVPVDLEGQLVLWIHIAHRCADCLAQTSLDPSKSTSSVYTSRPRPASLFALRKCSAIGSPLQPFVHHITAPQQ